MTAATPRDEFDIIVHALLNVLAPPIVSTPEEVAKRRAERMDRILADAEYCPPHRTAGEGMGRAA